MVLVDTNVIIEAFKGTQETIELLESIGLKNLVVSTITQMELYIGALNKNELNLIRNRLKNIKILDINKKISQKGAELVYNYSKSHNLDIPDSIIAATALIHNIPLLTYNLRDFRFIPGLNLSPVD
jgi:predicted nucleic acid-binding protein